MPLEERGPHVGARGEETPVAPGCEEPVTTRLSRVEEKASKGPLVKFISLYHTMNEELLRGCFERLGKGAVAGTGDVA